MIKNFFSEGDIRTRLRKANLLYAIYKHLINPERNGSKDLEIAIEKLNLEDSELIDNMQYYTDKNLYIYD